MDGNLSEVDERVIESDRMIVPNGDLPLRRDAFAINTRHYDGEGEIVIGGMGGVVYNLNFCACTRR